VSRWPGKPIGWSRSRTSWGRARSRETDVLIATGEQVTVALLAIALNDAGCPAVSFLGHQVRIATDSSFGKARIKSIDGARITAALDAGRVVVVAASRRRPRRHITTLGRGGSDTSAVALAAALRADGCEIYTDVEGVFTSDPRFCPQAAAGAHLLRRDARAREPRAKVLQIRSVEFAKRYSRPAARPLELHRQRGTWVVRGSEHGGRFVSGVTTIATSEDHAGAGARSAGLAARVFGPIADAGISVDMIIQNASADGTTDLTFTCRRPTSARRSADRGECRGDRRRRREDRPARRQGVDRRARHAQPRGRRAKMFRTLAEVGINIR